MSGLAKTGYTAQLEPPAVIPDFMRYRVGEQVDPDNPYPEHTQNMMELSYLMSIPLGLILLWLAIRGRVMWLKVWSVGLMVLGISLFSLDLFT